MSVRSSSDRSAEAAGPTGRAPSRARRRGLLVATLTAVALATAACGGSSGAGSTGSSGSSSGAVTKGGVLKIGTINYVDSVNPFNYIEAQGLLVQQMIFPTLVQYKVGATEFEGDLADSWQQAADGKSITFKLKTTGKWSDGKPITSDDVAWTINTTLKYVDDSTATQAGAVQHIVKADAPDAGTLVVSYDAPMANALPQLQTLPILPRHVWEPLAGADGKGLKTFAPEQKLPVVTGGAYTLEKWEKKGTTVLKADPNFYGPKSNVDAIALVYFTNDDAMLADLKAGKIDWVDEVPIAAATTLAKEKSITLQEIKGDQANNITWNSNPKKKKNRELLDPKVKKALSQTIDRARIIEVVYGGHANPVESILGDIAGKWENSSLGPLKRDVAAANATLDQLGYAKGADGIRVAPAKDGQPAHPMAYEVMVPDSINFNGKRQFEILRDNFAEAGVKLTLKAGGDSTAAYAYETGDSCDATKGTGYEDFDLATWDWVGYRDPDFQLSVVTKAQWCGWSDTGYDNPAYDRLYTQQATLVDESARKAMVDQMQKIVYDDYVYTQLVNMNSIDAHLNGWGGFHPELNGYSKQFYTAVGKTA
jgi:peptide/nickel transport system substrate-binding protein